MENYKYILEPYNGMNTRFICPSCNDAKKTFTRYINTDTGEYLHNRVGMCSRENNCAYHYPPKQYFIDNNILFDVPNPSFDNQRLKKTVISKKPISFIPIDIFKQSLLIDAEVLKVSEKNNFVRFLIDRFGIIEADKLIKKYFIGTSKYWNGATVFWQIDTKGKIRTGKIMLYNATTGKRVREPKNHIHWVHKAIKQAEFELKQCLFGCHLLQDITKPVAIIESEKAAIICSLYLPNFIWVSVGSLNNLNADMCSLLKGCDITLFPDLNGFEKWSLKAKELSHLAKFKVSDLLERKATDIEKKEGLDLADYLLRFDYKDFIKSDIEQPQPIKILDEVIQNHCPIIEIESQTNENDFLKVISDLEDYFKSITLPSEPIKLNTCSTIIDINKFIENHITILKNNIGKRVFQIHLDRLNELKQVLIIDYLK